MLVVVEEYNPIWAHQFDVIKGELEDILQGVRYLTIEHVGSTSVPRLAAKPVIDLAVISERDEVDAAIRALASTGGYMYMGERGIPDRHAFSKPGAIPARHLYVSVEGCQSIRNQLALRDICRNDPFIRAAYGETKRKLARRDWKSGDEYCEAKNDIIAWILEKAGMSSEDRDQIRKLNTRV
ncbi:hypothetical protein A1O3_06801 [Capronia epimyces CBS 606.96]|uniref:GrpB family protein n=1 Tax=Capronia epimyces CBS 606.96 TaxID=1182542 RepID=W9YL41_9EURO|nr:uncharacterized protein A1O3_06801 [Capronia epimyces CBS 606.96]EXJ82984.1 hypothetical protein A1O3_06801 [Capronia epimyces CBS 606.96]